MRRWMILAGLLAWLVAAPAYAGPRCWGPYTLSSNNYAPDSTGDDILDWVGDFSAQLAIGSGSLTVTVEAQNPGMGNSFAGIGQMTTTSIAQFHGPLSRLRFSVTSCSSCNATISVCGNAAE